MILTVFRTMAYADAFRTVMVAFLITTQLVLLSRGDAAQGAVD